MGKSQLATGEVLKGAKSRYTIVSVLSDKGGQGGVYLAEDLNKKKWAIKWYWKDEPKQKQRIQDLYRKGPSCLPVIQSPACRFIWPQDFVQNASSFGYAMELASYKADFSNVILAEKPVDMQALAKISINLCRGFDKLHSQGFCYKDISGGNIKFDLNTCNVEVLDCDNIRPDNEPESDVVGTEGFLAPEIVKGGSPNKISDRFSVAVMLFLLWCKQNPFEGTKAVLYEGNNRIKDLYSDPVFIFHPKDKSNTAERDPNNTWGKNMFALTRIWWGAAPQLLKEKFTEAFTDGLDPQRRKPESEWVKLFERILGGGYIEKCGKCGNHIAAESKECIFCGAPHKGKAPAGAASVKPAPANAAPAKPAAKAAPAAQPSPKKDCVEIYDGGKLTAEISLKAGLKVSGAQVSAKLSKMPYVFEVCTKPGDASLLGIRNLTVYNWTIFYKNSAEHRVLESGKAVLVRNVQKILLPAELTLVVY